MCPRCDQFPATFWLTILLLLIFLFAPLAHAQTQACAEPYAAPTRSTSLNLGLSEITNSAVTANSGQAIAYSVPQTAVNTTFIVQNNGASSAAYCAKFGVQLGQAVIGKPIKCFLNPYINAFVDSDSNGDYVSRVLAAGAQDFFVCPQPITGSYFVVIGTAPANTFQVFARVSAQPIQPQPNTWVSLFTSLLAFNETLAQAFGGTTVQATNPAANKIVSHLNSNSGGRTIYVDRAIVSCSAACDLLIQITQTLGTTCTAGTLVNMKANVSGGITAKAVLQTACAVDPVGSGQLWRITLPAAGFISLDLAGLVLPGGANNGVAVQMNANLTGTVSVSWAWGEK